MKQLKSDIPDNAVERRVEGCDGLTECVVDGRIVGRRVYNKKVGIVRETALKNGMRHGNEIEWDDDGRLLSVEPYFEGQFMGAPSSMAGAERSSGPTGLSMEPVMTSGAGNGGKVSRRCPKSKARRTVFPMGTSGGWIAISAVLITNGIGARESIMVSSGGGTIGGNCIAHTRSIGSVAKRLPNVSTSKQPSPTRLCRAFGLEITPPRRQFLPVIQKVLLRPTPLNSKG